MNLPITIIKIESAGGHCPYQIEGITDDGKYFYLRYRGGRFRAGVAKDHAEFWNRTWTPENSPYNIIDIEYGHPLDGSCNETEHRNLLDGKVIFPDGFEMGDKHHYEEPEYDERDFKK